MTWFKIDDGFWSHPKVMTLSDPAVALWVRAGAYSCQHLTDGHVPTHVLRLLGSDADIAGELATSGLWRAVKSGWQFHDWGEYQETAHEVKARRDKAKQRMRKARESRRTNGERSREQPANVQPKFGRSDANPDPTRPDPTREVLRTSLATPAVALEPDFASERESAMILIPEDWSPNDLHRAKYRRPDLDELADSFRDHAVSTGRRCHGRAGWDAAFGNWVRKSKPAGGAATSKAQGWLDLANQLPPDPDEQRAIGR